MGVKFNDSHIPESPYKVYVTPANKDAHRVSVNQLPDAGVQVGGTPSRTDMGRLGHGGREMCPVLRPVRGIALLLLICVKFRLVASWWRFLAICKCIFWPGMP